MGKSKIKRKRRSRSPARKRGGVMLGMRSGFQGVTSAVTGESEGTSKWVGRIVTLVLIAAAVGLLLYRL